MNVKRPIKLGAKDDYATVPLTRGHVAKVDFSDLKLVLGYSWCARESRDLVYAVTQVKHLPHQRMHRLILDAPPELQVDHINGDTLDNRRQNLRLVNTMQNKRNGRPYKGSSSQYKGVAWEKASGKWRAHIRVDKKLKHLGMFTDEVEAALAYNAACIEYFGDHACPNVIEGVE